MGERASSLALWSVPHGYKENGRKRMIMCFVDKEYRWRASGVSKVAAAMAFKTRWKRCRERVKKGRSERNIYMRLSLHNDF